MADKRNAQQYEGLTGFGVIGGFQALIDAAVRHQWTPQQFEHRLVLSKPFQHMFPGFVDHNTGNINTFLGSGSLSSQVARYRTLTDQYRKIASNYAGVKVGRDEMGWLIGHQVSADEFAARANAESTLKANPGLLESFNAELKAQGKDPLNPAGIRRFLAGSADANLYDTYEAAQLRAGGLNLNASEALNVAKQVGQPGQQVNTGALISQVKQQLGDIGPELDRQHISLSELVVSLGQQGLDASGIGTHIRQIIDQRRATGQYVAGLQARRGEGGGPALYGGEGAQSAG